MPGGQGGMLLALEMPCLGPTPAGSWHLERKGGAAPTPQAHPTAPGHAGPAPRPASVARAIVPIEVARAPIVHSVFEPAGAIRACRRSLGSETCSVQRS